VRNLRYALSRTDGESYQRVKLFYRSMVVEKRG